MTTLVIIVLFALLLFAPTLFPLISALDHDEKRTASTVGLVALVSHTGFWVWAFQQDLKGETLSAGLRWFVLLSVCLPILTWVAMRFVRSGKNRGSN